MSRIKSLYFKEIRYYANSAVAYVVGVIFLAFSSIWLFNIQQFIAQDQASFRAYFGIFPILFTIMIPAVTMRIWSEERRQGTLELLLTLPYRSWQLVLAKFLAPLSLLVILMVLTLPVPLMLSFLGNFDLGVVVTEYLGMILLAATGISIGMFISSLSRNQVVAFLVSVTILLLLTLMDQITHYATLPNFMLAGLQYLSLGYHSEGFIKGILDSRDILYYLLCSALFLFLNERSLVLKKWS